MKMKFSVVSAVVAGSLSLVLCSPAVAQMYGQKPPPGSAQAGGSPAAGGDAKKPGSVLEGGVIVATPITKEEAAKKYPAPKSGYPSGERDPHMKSGLVKSPYSPHKQFDCSAIGHGQLVLDTYANQVFARP